MIKNEKGYTKVDVFLILYGNFAIANHPIPFIRTTVPKPKPI